MRETLKDGLSLSPEVDGHARRFDPSEGQLSEADGEGSCGAALANPRHDNKCFQLKKISLREQIYAGKPHLQISNKISCFIAEGRKEERPADKPPPPR